jgi:serine/threonine protein kinase
MDHPNIAKVFDAGSTETGRPFFVMELVRGSKITEYCDTHRFPTRRRLELFVQVCDAVQHAHQNGIIHRDLKPSNILVTELDGVAVPKVIDFGIAKKHAGERLTDHTFFTAFEQFIGTPAYMSPEQAGFGGQDVDTRSDVYSLGVLLYELLSGYPPFSAEELKKAALDEILRTIREKEPVRPSTRLTTSGREALAELAKRRQVDPQHLPRMLRSELDWIVMKALEKDRTRRYPTASGMVADLRRYLNDEPVTARPPSEWYRLKKWIRRNLFWFFFIVAVVIALGFGLMTAFVFAVQRNLALNYEDYADRQESDMREEQQAMYYNQIALHDFLAKRWGILKTFDAVRDFSITNGNPNGVWSYTYGNGHPDLNALFFKSRKSGDQEDWIYADPPQPIPPVPLLGRNNANHQVGDRPPGQLVMYPGPGGRGEGVHVIWQAPQDGLYWVDTRIELLSEDGDLSAGVVRNIPSRATYLASDWLTRGNRVFIFKSNLVLKKGDAINFSVAYGRRWKNYNDLSTITATIEQYGIPSH